MWINRNPQIWEKGHRDNACQCDSHHIEHRPELKQTEGYRFSDRGQCQGMDIWQQQDRESYWKTQWNLCSDRRQGNRQTTITITMKSGIKKTVTITVKKPVVKTRKITKVPTKISLKRGKISARCKATVK